MYSSANFYSSKPSAQLWADFLFCGIKRCKSVYGCINRRFIKKINKKSVIMAKMLDKYWKKVYNDLV